MSILQRLSGNLTFSDVVVVGVWVSVLGILFQVRKGRKYQDLAILPKLTVAISPTHPLNEFFGRFPRSISWGKGWASRLHHEGLFGKVGSDLIQLQSFSGNGRRMVLISDAAIIKTILRERLTYRKPPSFAKFVNVFGPNILSAEGDAWRDHRRISGQSFNEKNLHLVWETTVESMLALFEKWSQEGNKDSINVSSFGEITTEIAFMVFVQAGFGISLDWKRHDAEIPKGHGLTFDDALLTSARRIVLLALFPDWLLRLFPTGRQAITASNELKKYMDEMIEERQQTLSQESGNDLLTNLVRAAYQDGQTEKAPLFTKADVTGNMFLYLIAGHETTANSLAFTVAYLAVYQEEQEELYQHIRSVVPEGRLPVYQDIAKLYKVLAFINEALRLKPIIGALTRGNVEDTILKINDGSELSIPSGAALVTVFDALHHNPKYWPDPYQFRPSRFYGEYNKDAFMSFSGGPRVCIGRRFSEIEQIAVISLLVLHFKIDVMEEPRFAHETPEQRKARVLASSVQLTLTPDRVPVTFTRRQGAEH